MVNRMKLVILRVRKIYYYCKHHMLSWISYTILVLCALMFLVSVCASIAHRVPIVSKLGETIRFPQKYELNGKVTIIDSKEPDAEEILLTPIEISIGGFSKKTYTNDEFSLTFISNNSKDIPVIITYKYRESKYNEIERISFDTDYSINHIFAFRVGE